MDKILLWKFHTSTGNKKSLLVKFLRRMNFLIDLHLSLVVNTSTFASNVGSTDRLRMFENRVPRRIFGPKRDEVTGEWRKLDNKELHDLYSSPSIIRIIKSRRMRLAGHVARMGEKRNAYKLLVGKSLGRPRCRCVDNIRMDHGEVG
jgi:hypothetical protein